MREIDIKIQRAQKLFAQRDKIDAEIQEILAFGDEHLRQQDKIIEKLKSLGTLEE